MTSTSGKILFLQEDSEIDLSVLEGNLVLVACSFPQSDIIVVSNTDQVFPVGSIVESLDRLHTVATETLVCIPLMPLMECFTRSSDWLLVFPANFPLDNNWVLFAQSWIQSSFSANFVRRLDFADMNNPMSPYFWFFKPKECELVETSSLTGSDLQESSSFQQISRLFRDKIYSRLIESSHVLTHRFIFCGEEHVNLLQPSIGTPVARKSLIPLPSSWQKRIVHAPKVGAQYLLLKGAEGFADRMECLLQAIFYCCRTNRILVVDWSDTDWSHADNYGMENILEVRGIRSMQMVTFESYIADNSCPSVFPSAWKDKLFLKMTLAEQRESSLCISSSAIGEGSLLQDIGMGIISDFSEDIVVFNGYGPRVYFPEIATALCLETDVSTDVEDFMNANSLYENQYDVCHLRGGSKHWLGGSVRSDSPVWADHNQWADSFQYLDAIYHVYKETTKSCDHKRLIIVSDSPLLYGLWRDRYGIGHYIPVSAGDMKEGCGIHKISSSKLADRNLSKHTVNREVIRDFMIMLRSRFLFGDSVSRFSLLAFRLKQARINLSRSESL